MTIWTKGFPGGSVVKNVPAMHARVHTHTHTHMNKWAAQVALVVKNPPASSGEVREMGSIPGSGRFPGEGNGNPFQLSLLENPMGGGAWQVTVHKVAKSWIWLKWLSTHTTHMNKWFVQGCVIAKMWLQEQSSISSKERAPNILVLRCNLAPKTNLRTWISSASETKFTENTSP